MAEGSGSDTQVAEQAGLVMPGTLDISR